MIDGFVTAHVDVKIMESLRSILGIAVFIGVAWTFSEGRRHVSWKLISSALGLQLVVALAVLKVPFIERGLDVISQGFVAVLSFANRGAQEVFGRLTSDAFEFSTVIGFRVVPAIIFFSSVTSVLYYYGILQKVVYGLAWIMKRTMKLSGAESLAAAANVFIGQTEALVMVRPYLNSMTRSEVMSLMTGGMATIAGTVLAAYIGFLGGDDPAQQALFGKHLITASILSAPAALMYSKLLVPETQDVNAEMEIADDDMGTNVFDAIARGTTQGLTLAFNVGAMIIVFVAFVTMINYLLSDVLGQLTGLNDLVASWSGGRYETFSMELIFGVLFAPFAWLMGIDSGSVMAAGQLLGEKLVINEFIAYLTFGGMKESGVLVDERSIILITYALCGFANFASMGIQIGGISSIAPSKRAVLCQLALRSVLAGNLACFTTACVAGMFI